MLTYNRAGFIEAAIASVRSQTYTSWQLTIIDDGSTDSTESKVRSLADERITYVRNPHNTGLLSARMQSLAHAKGAYTAVIDSDDVWTDKHKLEKQVAFMETNPECAVVGTFITHINEQDTIIGTTKYATTDRAIRNRMLLQNQFAHSSVLMRTALLNKTEGYRMSRAEDLDLFLQLGTHGTFANLPSYMTAYRIHKTNTSKGRTAMIRSIDTIIRRHAHAYPHAFLAQLKNYMRFLL